MGSTKPCLIEHILLDSKLMNSIVSLIENSFLSRWLKDVASKKPAPHRCQRLIHHAKQTILRLGILYILDQLKRLNRGEVNHHCAFGWLVFNSERVKCEGQGHRQVNILESLCKNECQICGMETDETSQWDILQQSSMLRNNFRQLQP